MAAVASLVGGAGQAAAAPLNALGRSRHLGGVRILGAAMAVTGVFVMIGAFTGRLAPMIAALFYPTALTGSGTTGQGPPPLTPGGGVKVPAEVQTKTGINLSLPVVAA